VKSAALDCPAVRTAIVKISGNISKLNNRPGRGSACDLMELLFSAHNL